MILTRDFYAQDVLTVAPLLLGKLVCKRQADDSVLRMRIQETEAYRGMEDTACHASKGKTPRTRILFEQGGHCYVYLVYGMHWLMNVVTGGADAPQAVLVRAMEAPFNGPAKWTKHMGVTGAHNGLWLPENEELWLEDDGFSCNYVAAPRVGIDYATEPWRSIPWRFIAQNRSD